MSDLIDNAYWLKFAKDQTDKAIQARDEAATNLDSYLGTVWGLFIAVFTAGVAFDKIPLGNLWLFFLIVLPVLLIPIARYLCVAVKLPVSTEFRPDSPASIRDNLYKEVVLKKTSRMRLAAIGAVVCGISIGISLFAYNTSKYDASNKKYTIHICTLDSAENILVSGIIDPEKSATGIITSNSSADKLLKSIVFNINKSDKEGKFVGRVLVPKGVLNYPYKVYIIWTDNSNQERIITDSITR